MLALRMTRVTVLLVGAVLLSLACSVTPHFVDDKPGGIGGADATPDAGVPVDVDTPCETPNDCSGQDGVCLTRKCVEKKCRPQFTGRGITLPTEQTGDCHAAVCDGAGHEISQVDILDRPANVTGDCKKPACSTAGDITEEIDDTDIPAEDGNPCTTSTCSNGDVRQSPHPNDESCGVCMWCQQGTCMNCSLCVSDACVQP